MSLLATVLVNDITNLSEARYCAGMGVNMLGFRFDGSEANVKRFTEISSWVAGVSHCASFTGYSIDEVKEILAQYPISYVLTSTQGMIENLADTEIGLIYALDIANANQAENLADHIALQATRVDYFLITCSDDFIKTLLINKIKQLPNRDKILIGFGFDATNVVARVAELGIAGIALHGTEEERPGFHEYGDLMDVLEALEVYS